MNGHKANCDCNYCEHVKHCVLVHDELVKVLELTKSYIKNNEDKLDETQELVELVYSISKALLKAKAK